MDEGGASPAGMKVVDRRWFTEDGELRDQRPATTSSEAPAVAETVATPPKPPPPAAAPAARDRATATSPVFLELVAMLAQQAELLLAGGEGFSPQPAQAQRLIDYLGILETKTSGNLSAEERQILANIIFELRSLFIQERR